MTRAELCAVKQHSAELQQCPHVVWNSLQRKQKGTQGLKLTLRLRNEDLNNTALPECN